jgi:hypothetical protein
VLLFLIRRVYIVGVFFLICVVFIQLYLFNLFMCICVLYI